MAYKKCNLCLFFIFTYFNSTSEQRLSLLVIFLKILNRFWLVEPIMLGFTLQLMDKIGNGNEVLWNNIWWSKRNPSILWKLNFKLKNIKMSEQCMVHFAFKIGVRLMIQPHMDSWRDHIFKILFCWQFYSFIYQNYMHYVIDIIQKTISVFIQIYIIWIIKLMLIII